MSRNIRWSQRSLDSTEMLAISFSAEDDERSDVKMSVTALTRIVFICIRHLLRTLKCTE